MYYAQFEAQKNTVKKVSWHLSYMDTVEVKRYYESMDVRGNVLRLDKDTGHVSIEKELTTYFLVNRGYHESISEYIIYGTKVMEIRKTLSNDVIIFEYREHELTRDIADKDVYANTGKFISKIPSGSNLPNNGQSGGYWFVRGSSQGDPLVYNLKDGDTLSLTTYVNPTGDVISNEFELRWIAGNTRANEYYLQWNKDGNFSDGEWDEYRITNYSTLDDNSLNMKADIPLDIFPLGETIYLRLTELQSSNDRLTHYDVGYITVEDLNPLQPPRLVSPSPLTVVNGKNDLFRITWTVPFEEEDAKLVKTVINARVRRANGSTSGWREFVVYGDIYTWEDEEFSKWLNGIAGILPSEVELYFQAKDNYGRTSITSEFARFSYSPTGFNLELEFDGEVEETDKGETIVYVEKGRNKARLKFPLEHNNNPYYNEVRTSIEFRNETRNEVLENTVLTLTEDSNEFEIVPEHMLDYYFEKINVFDDYSLVISQPRIDETISAPSIKVKLIVKPVHPEFINWSVSEYNDHFRFSFKREANEEAGEVFQIVRKDLHDDAVYVIGESTGEDIVDFVPHPKGSVYSVLRTYANGTTYTASVITPTPVSVPDYPTIFNMTDGRTTRVRDVVVTDTSSSPSKSMHYMAGRKRRMVEYGTHVDNSLTLSWLVDDLDELHSYLDRFKTNDILLYTDNEGRYMFLSVDNLNVKESYNKLRWQIDMTTQEVDGLQYSSGAYYDWKGVKHEIFKVN